MECDLAPDGEMCSSAAGSYEEGGYAHECVLDNKHEEAHKCWCGEEW